MLVSLPPPLALAGTAGALAIGGLYLMRARAHIPKKYGPPASTKAPQPPAGHAGSFHPSSDNKLWLFTRKWEPPVGQAPKACLQILHGTVDHSNAYHDLATFLAGNGIAVHATDMRGWGLSDGDELFFDDPQAFIDDAVGMDAAFRRDPRYARVPNFILGKSIGGLVAARAVQQHPEVWKGGFIGLSPAYSLHREVQPTPILRVLLRVLNAVSPKLRVKPVFDPKLIVSDAAALERWKSDPLVSRGWATAAYLANLLDQMDRLHSDCSKGVSEPLDIPALMLLGTGDRVVSMQGLEDTCKLFRRGSRVTTYEGGFHNLLEEPAHKDRVKRDILAFIESQV